MITWINHIVVHFEIYMIVGKPGENNAEIIRKVKLKKYENYFIHLRCPQFFRQFLAGS